MLRRRLDFYYGDSVSPIVQPNSLVQDWYDILVGPKPSNWLTALLNSVTSQMTGGATSWASTEFDLVQMSALMETVEQAETPIYTRGTSTITTHGDEVFNIKGYYGNGTSQYIDMGFKPLSHGVKYTRNSACIGTFQFNNTLSGTNVTGCGDNTTSQNYLITGSTSYARVNGFGTDVSVAGITDTVGVWSALRPNSTTCQLWKDNVKIGETADTSFPLTDYSLFTNGFNNNITGLLYNTAQNGVVFAGSGNINQANLVTAFNTIKTVTDAAKIAYFFGDSNTIYDGRNIINYRWSSTFSRIRHLLEVNYGISGTSLQNSSPTDVIAGVNMYDRRTSIPAYNGTTDEWLFISYGINDCGINGPNYTTATYTTQFGAVIDYATGTKGWPVSKIVIGSDYFTTNAGWSIFDAFSGSIPHTSIRLIHAHLAHIQVMPR